MTGEILDAYGRPARERFIEDDRCPGKEGVVCGANRTKRIPNATLGARRWPVCGACGYEWKDEDWHD